MINSEDKTTSFCLQLSFLFLVVQAAILALFWSQLPPQLPLFYNRPWGKEQLTSPIGLLTLPVISLLVILVNLAVASLINKEEKLLNQLLIIFTTAFSFLCLIALFKIVTLIT